MTVKPRRRRVAEVAVIAAALLTFAGCEASSSDTTASGSTTTTLVTSAAEEITAVCASWKAQLDARGPMPVAGFDPGNPDPAQLPSVGAYFGAGLPVADAAIAQIEALTVPQAEQADVAALVAAMQAERANAQRQVDAANAADVAGFVATLDLVDALGADVTSAAEALGVDNCGF